MNNEHIFKEKEWELGLETKMFSKLSKNPRIFYQTKKASLLVINTLSKKNKKTTNYL